MDEEKGSEVTGKAERQAPAQPLSRKDFASALHRSLRHYPRLETLEANPLLDARIVAAQLQKAQAPETPAQALRESIREQSQSWGDAPKTAILEQALRLTYLEPMRSQQTVADTLNMSWSTYRRRLAEARELLTTQLWQMELLLAAEPTSKPQRKKSPKPRRPGGRRARFAAKGLVGALVIAGLLVWHFGPWHGASGAEAATPSIAVLPFENLSADPANAYFTSGIQDEILTRLASIRSLKVISRTSTSHYTSRPDDLRRIARQLGVTTVLEGSVQKSGDEVHVNVQLIDARTQAHIWAHSYNRKLAKVFAVEGEVAQEIATALDAQLTAPEVARVKTPPTRNAQAYDAYLKGRFYANHAFSSLNARDFDAAIANYRKATAADPGFALARARLSLIESAKLHVMSLHGKTNTELAKQAKADEEKALKLAPSLAVAHLAQGYYRDYVRHDTTGQLAAFKSALEIAPRSSEILYAIGGTYLHLARFEKATEYLNKALEFDPRNTRTMVELGVAYKYLRHYRKSIEVLERAHSLNPDSVNAIIPLVSAYALGNGDYEMAIATLDAAPASVKHNPFVRSQRAFFEFISRDYGSARKMYASLTPGRNGPKWVLLKEKGDLEWAAGKRKRAREYYEQAATLIEPYVKLDPSGRRHAALGWIYARLGQRKRALDDAHIALRLTPLATGRINHMHTLLNLAQVQAQLGYVAKAVANLGRLLAMPAGALVSVPMLRIDPNWDSIRHDPRFQALLKQHAQLAGVASAAGTSP